MTFLLLNQTFYPDVASTAQHLSDLAVALVQHGHDVTVLASRRAYDDPTELFPKQETWRGVRIIRIGSTGFGKGAKWKRAFDFGSFLVLCALRLVILPRYDAIVALTSPPLISFLAAWVAKIRRSKFYYWVMDFNPDEAIAAGWLRPGSFAARVLERMSLFSLRHAARIIALDRFMRDRIVAKQIPAERIIVLPPWSHDGEVRFDLEGRERFRTAYGLDKKFVVMYSGNHSPCHPLDSLLKAAEKLADDPSIMFCFIGGGSEWRRIKEKGESRKQKAKNAHSPDNPAGRATQPNVPSISHFSNLLCLPYQPLSQLSASLSAADLHVVVMGDAFVGLVHPCKIYNILTVAAPVVYIGPEPSHLSEIFADLESGYSCWSSAHGAVDHLVQKIKIAKERTGTQRQQPGSTLSRFSKQSILPKLIGVLESD